MFHLSAPSGSESAPVPSGSESAPSGSESTGVPSESTGAPSGSESAPVPSGSESAPSGSETSPVPSGFESAPSGAESTGVPSESLVLHPVLNLLQVPNLLVFHLPALVLISYLLLSTSTDSTATGAHYY